MSKMEKFKTWYRRTMGVSNSAPDGMAIDDASVVSCPCIPRTWSSGNYEMRKADPEAGALADIKAHSKTNSIQKSYVPKVDVHFHSLIFKTNSVLKNCGRSSFIRRVALTKGFVSFLVENHVAVNNGYDRLFYRVR